MRRFASVMCWTLIVVASTHADPPNLILVTVDALRPDRLASTRDGLPLMPTLDSLAATGARFTNAFTSAAWTSPGLVSCLTGRHEPSHGVDTREKSLSPSVATLAGELVAAGYRAPDICYLVGSPNYQNLGFEDFPHKQDFLTAGHDILFRWLDECTPAHQPFFLYYHYRDLHQPYDPSPPFDTRFLPGRQPPSGGGARERFDTVRQALLLPEGRLSFAPSDTGWVRGLYDGEVAEADARFFRPLFDRLRRMGIHENTMVIVSADHGEELLEHGNVGHASTSLTSTLFDEELRIPLIIVWPGRIPDGLVADDLVQIVDIMPTVLDLLGMPTPEGVQGRSLAPRMHGAALPATPVFVSSVLGGYQATAEMQRIRLRAVRTDQWKLVRRDEESQSSRQLFHLAEDPAELHECAGDYPAVADSLEGVLEGWLARCRDLYRQPLWAGETGRKGCSVRPLVVSPQQGDSLTFAACNGRLGVRLDPVGAGDVDIEYCVGVGPYHVEGVLPAAPDGVLFGPFTPTFWNTLVGYNPWRFRVLPSGHPELATEWITFHLLRCDQ